MLQGNCRNSKALSSRLDNSIDQSAQNLYLTHRDKSQTPENAHPDKLPREKSDLSSACLNPSGGPIGRASTMSTTALWATGPDKDRKTSKKLNRCLPAEEETSIGPAGGSPPRSDDEEEVHAHDRCVAVTGGRRAAGSR
jgi:hypothetical protein